MSSMIGTTLRYTLAGAIVACCSMPLQAQSNNPKTPAELSSDKARTEKLYKEAFGPGDGVGGYHWNGNVAKCKKGTVDTAKLSDAIARINFYRAMVGLYPVQNRSSKNDACQQLALCCDAKNTISHYIDESWKCYTKDAATAGVNSNISYGALWEEGIDGFIADDDEGNESVGHRRWILYSKAPNMGMGAAEKAYVLWCHGDSSAAPEGFVPPEIVAWPKPGYNPLPIFPTHWHFSVTNELVNLTKATVTVKTAKGVALPMVMYQANPRGGYMGDNALIWNMTGGFQAKDYVGQGLVVTIKNVYSLKDKKNKTYTYTVFPFVIAE